MLNDIIKFSIKNKLLIILAGIFLIVYGIYQFTLLPIDAVPDITDNQVQIITSSPALGAPDVERFISFPIEQAISNIPSLKEVRSFSRFGLSVVTVVFHDDIDVYWARQQVFERLQLVKNDIPEGLGTPTLAPVTTGLGEIYQYVVRPKKGYENQYSPIELRTIQDWIVRRQLLGVPGVADVSSFGGKLKQYQIVINTQKLKQYNLTISDIFDALANNNQNTGGAYIEKGPVVLFIRSEGLVNTPQDIENIVVHTTATGFPIKISDIARVQIDAAIRYGALCYNDEGEAAGAVVMMLKGENSSAVIERVKDRIAEIQKALPEGVLIEPFLDRTKMVNNAIHTVSKNLLEGALIVVFVLVLFLGNIRAGLITASVIPLSMLFAIIMMNIFGVSGNLMSLGALDFGLIVDGAVIIVEAVMHQLTHHRLHQNHRLSQAEMDNAVQLSANKMMSAAIFGQIIILIVYLPIFTLQGIEGKMFKPMAQTVTFALIGAFILSLTYVPVITTLVLNKSVSNQANFSDKIMSGIENFYCRVLNKLINFPKTIAFASLLLLGISLWIASLLGGEFIPELEEGDFAVETRVLSGSSLQTTIKSVQQASGILIKNFPEVEKVVTKIGSGEIPTDPMPIEASDMMIILKDKSEWTSAETFDELAEKMGEALADVPGVTTGFQYPVQMRFNELMTGGRQDVICKIFGENMDTLAKYAAKVGEVVQKIEGAKDIYVETVSGMPQIVINYNRPLIAQYGLNIADINRAVNAAFAGATAGQVFEDEKRFDLVVRLEQAQRSSLSDVQNLQIATPNGTQMPLSHFATVEIVEGATQIQRENAQRRIIVGFNVRGKDVQTVVEDLQNSITAQLKLPPAYFITYGGSFENLRIAKQRLSIAVPVSLLLIFLMLYLAFNSIKQGLLIYTAIPLSAIGGIILLAARGLPFSISAGIGFIALFGVAVLNGIVLITEFNRLKEFHFDDIKELVLQGTRTRLRPVLMTATVASLGFLPMAFSNGAGAEVQRPLATVVIGGLLTATILTLFVLPALYVWLNKNITPPNNRPSTVNALSIILFVGTGLSLLPQQTLAQTPATTISLPDAIALAIKNNPTWQVANLHSQYYQTLTGAATDIPKTDFGLEIGQLNSIAFDYKMSAAQSFSLPKVYKSQAQVYRAQAQAQSKQIEVKQKNIAFEITQLYGHLLNFASYEKVLLWADSLYTQNLTHAQIRVRLGEANILEQTNAELQLAEIAIQTKNLHADKAMLLTQFNRLLGDKANFIPNPNTVFTPPMLLKDTLPPDVQQKQSEILVKEAEINLEKAKASSPDFSVGLTTQSFTGYQRIGGEDRYFATYPRFVSLQLGMSLPIYKKASNAKIQAATIQKQITVAEAKTLQYDYQKAYQKALDEYLKAKQQAADYEQKMLPLIPKLIRTADQQLNNGEINFMQWTSLINQSIAIKTQYEQLKQQTQTAVIQLQYFINYKK